ncbi:MAG: LysM peptidoglycan-binding domain-containing protein [Bacteroidetes bacterium]|nr:LysM peptidoglycan-binding domain-containing protein [Bacteroidota bacterium]
MNCPVCQQDGLEDGAVECSKCGSDISSFSLIGSLKKERSRSKIIRGILGAMVVGVVVAWAVLGKSSTNVEVVEDEKINTEIQKLKNELSEKKNEIVGLNNDITKLRDDFAESQNTVNRDDEGDSLRIVKGHTFHVVKEGESLWSISEDYYGDGFKHDRIADHNELDDKHFIKAGDTIIIKH